MDGLLVTGPLMWCKYLEYVHLPTKLASIFNVDNVNQHMHVPYAAGEM